MRFRRILHTAAGPLLAVVAAAIVSCLPWLTSARIYNQDDFLFHKARLLAYYASVVQHHDFLPRVFSGMANHFGYAADVFYNSWALLPFVFFKRVLGGFVLPYQLYLAAIAVATAVSAYACARKITQPAPAALAAVLYVTNTYRLIDLYLRGALGEGLAYMILPLVALGFYQTLTARRWRVLAVGMSGLVLVHPLSAVLAAAVLAGVECCWLCRRQLSWAIVKTQAQAALATVLWTLFLTLPMLEQTLAQPLYLTRPSQLWSVGLNYSFSQLLGNSLSNAHGVWADLAPNIGPLALGVLGVALWQYRRLRGGWRVLAGTTAALLILSSNLVLWPLLKDSPAAIIQFEWRLLSFVALGTALLAIAVVKRHRMVVGGAALLLALSFNAAATQAFADSGVAAITDKNAATTAPEAIGGGTEFLPSALAQSVATDPLTQTLEAARGKRHAALATRVSTTSSGGEHYTFAAGSRLVILPKTYYRGYAAGNHRLLNVNGLLGVRVSAKATHLSLAYVGTPVQHLSVWASALAVLALLPHWRRRRGASRLF